MLILFRLQKNLALLILLLVISVPKFQAQLGNGIVSYSETFNGSLGTTTAASGSNGNWIYANSCGYSSSSGHSTNGHALFSGSGCTFGNGGSTTSGNIITPTISVGSTGGFLSFNYVINGECGANFCPYDNLAVYISNDNGTTYNLLVSSNTGYQSLPPATSWANFTLSLNSYSNQAVKFLFNFNSIDGINNNLDGIYLDDIIVTNYCSPPANPTNTTTPSLLTRCGSNTTTTLTAAGNGTITWYASATSTAVLSTGPTYVTPTLSSGANVFYAMVTNTCASSNRAPFAVNVTGINILNSGGTSTFCPGTPIVLTATTLGGHSGNGSLGNATVNTTMYTDSVRSAVVGTNNTGPKRKVRVASTTGFLVGQEVMLVTMQDPNATNNLTGQYEYTRIQSISGDTLLFSNLLNYNYDATSIKHQVIVVPNYNNLTVASGGNLICHNWDGATGGVLALRVKGLLDIQSGGMVSASGAGYRGTPPRSAYFRYSDGAQGEGYLGLGYAGTGAYGSYGNNSSAFVNPNGNGGGGGIGTQDAAGGGGGGNGAVGGDGVLYSHQFGYGGKPVGDATLGKLFMGGAGGEGGGDEDGDYPGNGGSGGGIIAISASSLNVIGGLFADGVNGGSGFNAGGCGMGGGGGGAGGSIYLQMLSFSGTPFNIEALGGFGGAPGGCGGAGGNGSVGRIRVDIAAGSVATNPLPYAGNYPLFSSLSYSWNTGATTNTISPAPAVTSNYTVTVTSGVCSGQTASISIPVHPSPTISVVSISTICAGNTTSLIVTGANSYTWNTGATGNTLAVTPPTSTVIGVYGTSSLGCVSNSVATPVTVYTLPVLSVAGNNTVCTGGSVPFTGSGASTYTWSFGGSGATATLTPGSSTTFTLSGTSAQGCSSLTVKTLSVIPLPTVSASANQSICLNQTITLNGSGATTYTWSSVSGTLANAVVFTPSATGSYSLAGTNSVTGCTSTNNAVTTITVAPLPTVVATVNSNTVCAGLTVTLSGSGANTYTFTGGPVNNTAFTPTANGSYTLTGTDLAGCTSTNLAFATVTVVPRPIVSTTSSASQICLNQSVTLTGSGANTYTWSGGAINGTPFSPTTTTTYTLAGTSTAGCTSTNSPVITVTVNSLPIVGGTASSPSICINKTVTLNGSGASSYTWSSPTGTIANNTAFSPTSTAQYTVSGTSVAGCTNSNFATVSISVAPLPIVVASSNTTAICMGGSLTLTGSGANTYSWTNGAPNGTPFSPTSTATYSLIGTDLGGCTSTNTAIQTITVYALPTVTAISSASAICNTQSVSVTGAGAVTYTWSGGVSNAAPFTPSITATYSVTGTDNNGCVSTNSAFKTITVNPLPFISASASQTFICIGTSVTLNGSGALSYTWTSPTGTIANNSAFSPTATANYSVTGTSAAGCASSNTANITVTVNPLPVLTVAATPSVICAGFTSTLSALGANTYTWSNSAQSPITSVTATLSTNYTVVATSTAGCQNSAVASLSVNPLPTLTITSSPTTICFGQSISYTASGANSYSWNTGATTASISVTPSINTQYTLTGVSAANCSNTAITSASVNPLPVVSASVTNTLVCGNTTVIFGGSGANTYTWTGGPVNNQTFMPMSTASYSLTGTSLAGCTSTNVAAVTVTVKPNLSVSGNNNNVPVGNTTSTLNFTDFGNTASRTFSITNFGGASTLNIGSISFTGPQASQFSVTTLPATAITTGTTGFVVTLTPTNTGISTATVNIASNDCTYPNYTFVITASTTPASALKFDGVDDYINCPNILGASYTKEAWIKMNASTNGNNFVSGSASSGGHAFWAPGIYSYKLSAGHDFTWTQVQDPNALSLNTWYHVAVTYDAPTTTMRLYKNGILVASSNTVAPIASTSSVTIGAFSGTFTMNGDMDEVRIWNTARTQCQIQQFMNCEIPNTATGLVANYHLNQGVPSGTNFAVTTATDAAAANTGTLLNFALTGTTSNWVNPSQIVSGYTITSPPNVTLQVSGNGASIASGSNAPNITNNTSFGHLCVGGTASTKVYSVTNTGTGTLNLGQVQYSGNGNFSIGTYSTLINPGAGGTFAVTFSPGLTPTINTGTLSLYTNDCAQPNYSFVINATVNALPVLTVSASSSVICNTQSVSLTASGANTYTWSTASGSITNGLAFNPSSTAQYSVTGTNTLTGCTSTNVANVTITVNPLPTVTATASSFTVCNTSTVSISGSGADTYTWTSPTGNIANNTPFNPTITASYSLAGTNTLTGCTSTNAAFTTVTVLALPIVSASTTSTVICMNQTVVLNGAGASSYTWSGAVQNNTPFSPTITANYGLTGTDLAGCTSTNNAFVTVSVNALPNVTASISNSVICFGFSTSVSGAGANTYTWSGGVTNNISFTPAASASYSVTGTDLAGCTSTNAAVVNLTVNALPLVQAIAIKTIVCTGDTTSLHGAGANTYTWSNGVANATSFTPVATTVYTVIGKDLNGCINQDSVKITVNSRPVVTGTVSRNVVCYNDTITFNAAGATTYTWSNGAINGAPINVFSSGDYSLTGTNTLGCTSSNTIVVTLKVNPLPIVAVQSITNAICFSKKALLTPTGAVNYTWSPLITGGVPFTPTQTATYTLTGSDANGCVNDTTYQLSVYPMPTLSIVPSKTITCEAETFTLTASGASLYTWSNNQVGTNAIVSPTASITYTLKGISDLGCADSTVYSHTVIPCSQPISALAIYTNVSCLGKDDGAIIVIPTIPYKQYTTKYVWTPSSVCPAQNCDTITKLAGGAYKMKLLVTYTVNGIFEKRDSVDIIPVLVRDENGPCEIKIFTSITPNGDGTNDVWIVDHLEDYPKNRVTIYNRWGKPVFDKSGYNNTSVAWPDKYDTDLTPSTYFYIIDLGNGTKPIKGYVELLGD